VLVNSDYSAELSTEWRCKDELLYNLAILCLVVTNDRFTSLLHPMSLQVLSSITDVYYNDFTAN